MHLVFLVGIWGPAKFPLPLLFLVRFRFLVALIKMIIFSSFFMFPHWVWRRLAIRPFLCIITWLLIFPMHQTSTVASVFLLPQLLLTFVCFLLSFLSLSIDKLSSWKVWWQKVYCCGQNDNWNVLLLRIWNSLTVTGDMGHTFVFGFVFDFLYL